MDRQITILKDRLTIESTVIGNERRYRWTCFCKDPDSWSTRKSLRDVWTTIEAMRQHWLDVHSNSSVLIEYTLIDWIEVHNQIPWLRGEEDLWIRLENGVSVSGTPSAHNYEVEEKVGMSRFDDIQVRLRELEKEAAKYARFERVDPWPVGTVVMYEFVPNGVDEEYTYAVLKAGNSQWYWTGSKVSARRSGHDYDALVECLADDGANNIRVALPADFKPLFPESVAEHIGEKAAEEVDKFLANPSTGVFIPRPGKIS